MTKEDREFAKSRIEYLLKISSLVFDERDREALEVAMQVLSQDPCGKCKYFDGNSCQHYDYKVGYTQGYEDANNRFRQEPCDNAISREAVIKILEKYNLEMSKIAEDVSELPSVTQKSGKWILLDECANSGYYCSNCQKKLVKEGWSQTVKKINYCPNCGAKMESEDK